jgi:hypothetical protein
VALLVRASLANVGLTPSSPRPGRRFHAPFAPVAAFQFQPASRAYAAGGTLPKEVVMSSDTKTPLDHVHDTLLQLKEVRHYSKNNVELLTTQWLLFDGELSKLKRAQLIEDLMTRQAEFHDAVEAAIADLEEVAVQLQPPPEEASG